MHELNVIIMAAGQGTRMNSKIPKVLHNFRGEAMINHVIRAATNIKPTPSSIIIIIGYKADLVKEYINLAWGNKIAFATQRVQLGTGHAVMQAMPLLNTSIASNTIVLSGDSPAITPETLSKLIEQHDAKKAKATILTNNVVDSTGYGRIVRDGQGHVCSIIEEKDIISKEVRNITEINTGFYVFDTQILNEILPKLDNNNNAGEYYLTDVIRYTLQDYSDSVHTMPVLHHHEADGVNTADQLHNLEKILANNAS